MVSAARTLTFGVALGVSFAALVLPGASQAAMRHGMHHMHHRHMHHRHMHMAMKPRLRPAQLKPTYHGMPGYAGGPAGQTPPMLVDMTPGNGMLSGLPLIGGFKL